MILENLIFIVNNNITLINAYIIIVLLMFLYKVWFLLKTVDFFITSGIISLKTMKIIANVVLLKKIYL